MGEVQSFRRGSLYCTTMHTIVGCIPIVVSIVAVVSKLLDLTAEDEGVSVYSVAKSLIATVPFPCACR